MYVLVGEAGNGIITRAKEFARHHMVWAILCAAIVAVLGVLAAISLLNRNTGGNTPAAQTLSYEEELVIYKKVREAMLPTSDVFNPEDPTSNFTRARGNMESLAKTDSKVAASRYYAVNMFEVCYRLSDEPCMRKQAGVARSLSTASNPYTKDTTKEIADKIAQYGGG